MSALIYRLFRSGRSDLLVLHLFTLRRVESLVASTSISSELTRPIRGHGVTLDAEKTSPELSRKACCSPSTASENL
ncbi:hypothetical protein EYF80_037616 [Liparis tanakae]|uniref:Uncharacterized protein n=1 Tax=Liparis tanakae TaxID=230148 RepID=A0A4Z2GF80_9TELE|nr:hypothetical protein EYF80_037616 [Liparis tanakae]